LTGTLTGYQAYEKLMTHRAKGKVVVNVGASEV
jgi:hypothetical protein